MPKKRKRFKKASKLLVVVGAFSLLMLSPIHHNDTPGKYMDSLTGRIEAQAADAFSPRWEIDGNGNWFYHLDSGGVATNAWVQDEVNGDWYLLSETGAMRVGLFQSNGGKYYLLDTVQGTGHYGRLLKNGQEFRGVIIQADTSADYEGALSEATLQQLEAQGLVSRGSAPNVSNTQHVSNGVVTSAGGGNTADNTGSSFPAGSENLSSDTSNGAVTYDGRVITNHEVLDKEGLFDKSVSAVCYGITVYKPKLVSQEEWDAANDVLKLSWWENPPKEVSLETDVVIGEGKTVALFEYKGEALDESNSIYDSRHDMIYIKPEYFSQEDWDSLHEAEKLYVGVCALYGGKVTMEGLMESREAAKNIQDIW